LGLGHRRGAGAENEHAEPYENRADASGVVCRAIDSVVY